MTSLDKNQTSARLEAVFGGGRAWTSGTGNHNSLGDPGLPPAVDRERRARVRSAGDMGGEEGDGTPTRWSCWHRRATPAKLRVAGPQSARPVRELPAGRVIELLEASRTLSVREAASLLAREFSRLEEAVVPGVRVKDFLTPHFLGDRLRRLINEQQLSRAIEGIAPAGSMAWRSLFQGLGYQVEQLPKRGYLLRSGGAPVAVVHPQRDASQFSRLTDNGEVAGRDGAGGLRPVRSGLGGAGGGRTLPPVPAEAPGGTGDGAAPGTGRGRVGAERPFLPRPSRARSRCRRTAG